MRELNWRVKCGKRQTGLNLRGRFEASVKKRFWSGNGANISSLSGQVLLAFTIVVWARGYNRAIADLIFSSRIDFCFAMSLLFLFILMIVMLLFAKVSASWERCWLHLCYPSVVYLNSKADASINRNMFLGNKAHSSPHPLIIVCK